MPTAQEKAAFSERLKCALRKSDPPVKDATDLARLFNLQHRAVSCIGIAVQAAHKWLSGLAIPSADKIATLAKWLNMSEH
ncbi:transcriptional regulator, partial [Candidatus Glomeribacter gigasporarum]|uniref:transcriptional regulator n=1 Tax=Candidatus Glomeribacter gigasporarum TaxID=132144 RepID=UPI0005B2E86C